MLKPCCTAALAVILLTAQAQAQTAGVGQATETEPAEAEIVASVGGCPVDPMPEVVEIREADPALDKARHDEMRQLLFDKAQQANTTILLGPSVVIDFSDAPGLLPVGFGPCVTLKSVASFPPANSGEILSRTAPAFTGRLGPGDVVDLSDLVLEQPRPELPVGSARTPSSPGGPSRRLPSARRVTWCGCAPSSSWRSRSTACSAAAATRAVSPCGSPG